MPIAFLPASLEPNEHAPLYLTSIGYDYTESVVDRPEGYADFHWLQTTAGKGELYLDGRSYSLTVNQGVLLYPDVPHKYAPVTKHWQTEWFTFKGNGAAAILHGFSHHASSVYDLESTATLSKLIHKGYDLSMAAGAHRNLELAGFIFSALVEISKTAVSKDKATLGHFDRLSPVLHYLDTHYQEPTELSKLSDMLKVSPQYLCTLFKNVTGNRPAVYINHLRINRAKELMLTHPEMTIAQVALGVGFESPSYFSFVFKKYEGVTPGAFIALHRA